jgi:hypothetical protein
MRLDALKPNHGLHTAPAASFWTARNDEHVLKIDKKCVKMMMMMLLMMSTSAHGHMSAMRCNHHQLRPALG